LTHIPFKIFFASFAALREIPFSLAKPQRSQRKKPVFTQAVFWLEVTEDETPKEMADLAVRVHHALGRARPRPGELGLATMDEILPS
jgi:hypothetical protein